MADTDLKSLSITIVIFGVMLSAVGILFSIANYNGSAISENINKTLVTDNPSNLDIVFSKFNQTKEGLATPDVSVDLDQNNDNKNAFFYSQAAESSKDLAFDYKFFSNGLEDLLKKSGIPSYAIYGVLALIIVVVTYGFISYMTGVK